MDKSTGSGRGFRLCNCRCCDRGPPACSLRAYVGCGWCRVRRLGRSFGGCLFRFRITGRFPAVTPYAAAKGKASPRKSPAAARNRCGHWIAELASRHAAAAQCIGAFQFPELLLRCNGHQACALCRYHSSRHYSFYDNVRLSRECRTDHCDRGRFWRFPYRAPFVQPARDGRPHLLRRKKDKAEIAGNERRGRLMTASRMAAQRGLACGAPLSWTQRECDVHCGMTKHGLEILLERVATWPQEAQEELLQSLAEIEKKHLGVYRLNEAERAAV